jgi:hypothetical protein
MARRLGGTRPQQKGPGLRVAGPAQMMIRSSQRLRGDGAAGRGSVPGLKGGEERPETSHPITEATRCSAVSDGHTLYVDPDPDFVQSLSLQPSYAPSAYRSISRFAAVIRSTRKSRSAATRNDRFSSTG